LLFREKVSALVNAPAISKVVPWDGKDAKVEYDEIPLDELMSD
jgi:hypothetical protein